jgi:hypothetical protein
VHAPWERCTSKAAVVCCATQHGRGFSVREPRVGECGYRFVRDHPCMVTQSGMHMYPCPRHLQDSGIRKMHLGHTDLPLGSGHSKRSRHDCICEWYMVRVCRLSICLPFCNIRTRKKRRLNVEFGAPPVTTLGVILHHGDIVRHSDNVASLSAMRTWILVSVFRRNHWGMGLQG